jgi:hypothetical protein
MRGRTPAKGVKLVEQHAIPALGAEAYRRRQSAETRADDDRRAAASRGGDAVDVVHARLDRRGVDAKLGLWLCLRKLTLSVY